MKPTNLFRGGGDIEEYFDVLDENGVKTGRTKLRQEVHRDGDWHRAVDIFIVNNQNEILLQRRSATKDSWPGKLDFSCGGHLVAGETALAAAVSELQEELGLTVRPDELEFLLSWKSSSRPAPDFINNSFNELYLLRRNLNLSELKLQEEEVAGVIWVSAAELRQMVERQDPDLVPHSVGYEKILEVLGA